MRIRCSAWCTGVMIALVSGVIPPVQLLEAQVGPPQAEPPVVTLHVTDDSATEQNPFTDSIPDTARVVVRRTGSLEERLTVYWRVLGDAVPGEDYPALPSEVVFPAKAAEVVFEIGALDDVVPEPAETILISLVIPVGRPDYPPAYTLGRPSEGTVWVYDDDPANRPPRVALLQPEDGAILAGPLDIALLAVGLDSDGWVPKVEFYANDLKIGEASIVFIREPDPGQEQEFLWNWEHVLPGTYALRVKAMDNLGAVAWSGPISIVVTPATSPTWVSIVAADNLATEPSADQEPDPGAFAVHRRGDVSFPLVVYYRVAGSAENGVDYQELSGEVTLPEGRDKARIQVLPLADERVEDTETVVVVLVEPPCIAIEPPPPECYRVGELGRAVVRILDSTERPNRPPIVELVRPNPDEIFQVPADIRMVAMAGDRDGRVAKVEFFADGVKVGEQWSDPTGQRTADVEGRGFTMEWSTDVVGRYVCYAVATDDDGAVATSREVSIRVIEADRPPLVRILVTDPHAAEHPEGLAPNPARFMVQRTGSKAQDLVVFYSVGGTATEGDYSDLGGFLTIPAGKGSARLAIEPLNDEEVEGVETVVIRLQPSPAASPIEPYRIGWPAGACAVIVDDDREMPIAQPLPGAGFHLCLPGEWGRPFRVEASDDLRTWVPISDVLSEDGYVRFAEPAMEQGHQRFYRVRPVVVDALPLDDE